MALDLETVSSIVKNYADEVRKTLPIIKVFLYGSYAKGIASEDSDVDVCFFLSSFGELDRHDITVDMLGLAHKYNIFIEPIAFEESDLYDDNPFVKEVLRTGIEIQ
jgi:predicted nucleotidyltransferase